MVAETDYLLSALHYLFIAEKRYEGSTSGLM